MGKLVLVRHGESRWNLCNRFQGWVDVPLSQNGVREAQLCADHCKKFDFSAAFTSELARAQSTLIIILSEQDRTGIFQHTEDERYRTWIENSNQCGKDEIPIFNAELLNERYYGVLQGMEKGAAERTYGKERLLSWRRGYEAKPPFGESLRQVYERSHPYFAMNVEPRVRRGEEVIVAGHGNTLRAIIKHLEHISERDISFVDLPEAQPIVYEFKRGKFQHISGDYQFNRPLR